MLAGQETISTLALVGKEDETLKKQKEKNDA